ncbi:hypothetical protein Bbelb_017440, partial [Branchiostoma belcheri]
MTMAGRKLGGEESDKSLHCVVCGKTATDARERNSFYDIFRHTDTATGRKLHLRLQTVLDVAINERRVSSKWLCKGCYRKVEKLEAAKELKKKLQSFFYHTDGCHQAPHFTKQDGPVTSYNLTCSRKTGRLSRSASNASSPPKTNSDVTSCSERPSVGDALNQTDRTDLCRPWKQPGTDLCRPWKQSGTQAIQYFPEVETGEEVLDRQLPTVEAEENGDSGPILEGTQLSYLGHECESIPEFLGQEYGQIVKRLDLSFNQIR